ncbi:MAG TPA: hypothetical protein VNZ49_15650 [Bacteroidia bacterium]|jgi:hypothetical protein|nr:hypothetical protein [Bacteroidia bacterium]
MLDDLSIFDVLLPPIYIFIAWFVTNYIQKKNLYSNPEYKYFKAALLAKIGGAMALGLVYFFYYKGGDTINYFESSRAYINLFFENKSDFIHGWFGNIKDNSDYSFFNDNTGYPVYHHKDVNSFFVVRLLIPIMAVSLNSYFACAVVTGILSFTGVWKLYKTFIEEFPSLKKELAIAILFIPSCIFWGSGIMKDSFTLSAVGWFTYSFYYFFIKKKRKAIYFIQIVIAAFIILSIKPYIFFALLPGSILWLSNQQIKKIENATLRFMVAPFFLFLGGFIAYLSLINMGDSLGIYKLDTVLDRAVIVQKDMKADYYGGNTYDIGDFDASTADIATKAPMAIFSGIFRPGLWDVKNLVMFISSLENTYLLVLTVFLLIRLKVFGFFLLVRKHPMLLFAMLFSLFFAFSVGLTVANFGSLVRLRIPELPFFVSGLFILRHLYEKQSRTKVRF